MSLADRLRQARLKKKLTQTELANAVGIKQQAIQRIEMDKVKSTGSVVQLSDALDVNPRWLALGEGPMDKDDTDAFTRNAPLIDWKDFDLLAPKPMTADELAFLPVTITEVTDSFSLKIKDDSMYVPDINRTSFAIDDILVIKRCSTAKSGDFVIAKQALSSEFIFRQYRENDLSAELAPLNTQYESIPFSSDTTLLGTVVLRYSLLV